MKTKMKKPLFAIAFAIASLMIAVMVPAAASAGPRQSGGSGCAQFYVVQRGDNLSRIAQRFGTTASTLRELNSIANPDRIYAGMTLCVHAQPQSPSGFWYTVQRGDTLHSIGRRCGWSASYLATVNHLTNPNRIYVGQVLFIPYRMQIQVYFAHTSLANEATCVKPVTRAIPHTLAVGQTAIEELLKGPTPEERAAGFWNAIPDQAQVAAYRERLGYTGDRVRLNSLRIVGGVAYVDFSAEMEAHGGGSARIMCLRQQIVRTLKQFPTVQEVVISVEGRSEDVLQP